MWYASGGRGSGKTRAGSEALAGIIAATVERGDDASHGDWAVVAPTFGDARDTCVEGPSGLRHGLAGYTDGSWGKAWNRSQGQLTLENGAKVFADGADDGALRVQGKNLRGAWLDEVGLWRKWDRAFNESVRFAVRLAPGVIIATGTPKAGHPLVRQLLDEADVVSRMRMRDNITNLHPSLVEKLTARYAGTTLGRQELDGEIIREVEGALWTHALITIGVVDARSVVVAVDPPGGATECGIVVAGREDARFGVLDDRSVAGSPDVWARAVAKAFHDYQADRVVVERNYGGDMVRRVLETVDPTLPISEVTATRGKALRAEPVVALYEQGRVVHASVFPDLVSEMTTWTPDESWSPNRLDALVWALAYLASNGKPARIWSPV